MTMHTTRDFSVEKSAALYELNTWVLDVLRSFDEPSGSGKPSGILGHGLGVQQADGNRQSQHGRVVYGA